MMELEVTCLLCNEPKSRIYREHLIDPGNRDLFSFICLKLGVSTNISAHWDFHTEPLPFCDGCHRLATEIANSRLKLAFNELDISENVERIKRAIKISGKVANRNFEVKCLKNNVSKSENVDNAVVESSDRFREFRNQASQGNCIRNISDRRLEKVTGIPVDNDDTFSQGTLDSLSDDEEAESGVLNDSHNELVLANGLGPAQSIKLEILNGTVVIKNPLITSTTGLSYEEDPSLQDLVANYTVDFVPPKWYKKDGFDYFGVARIIKPPKGTKGQWTCCMCQFVTPLDKKSPPKKTIQNHVKKAHYDTFKCTKPGCKKRFQLKADLEVHETTCLNPDSSNTPTSSKTTFSCSHCQKSYVNAKCLEKHEQTHVLQEDQEEQPSSSTKSKKFSTCRYCDKVFYKKSNYTRHVEIHEKPKEERKSSPCHICGNMFTKAGLTDHLRLVHKNGKVNYHYCKEAGCTQKFPALSRLNRHIKHVHKRILKSCLSKP